MVEIIKNRKIFLIGYFIFAFSFLIAFLLIEKGSEIIYFANNRFHFLNLFFRFMSFIVEPWLFVIFGIMFLFKDYRNTIFIGLVGVFSLIFSYGLKSLFKTPRPLLYFDKIGFPEQIPLIPNYESVINEYSFPSGHATAAFGLYLALAIILNNKKLDVLMLTLAILAALSRVYLANHFFNDILAGSLLGIILTITIKIILNKSKLPAFPFVNKA